jgi:hypothetical protein
MFQMICLSQRVDLEVLLTQRDTLETKLELIETKRPIEYRC